MESTPAFAHTSPAASTPPGLRSVQLLRATLRLNAATSALGGLVAAAAPGAVARSLGVESAGWVRLIGLSLIVFALDVGLLSRAGATRIGRFAPIVSGADAVWVLASAGTIAAGWYSATGTAIVTAVALAVGGFATAQILLARLVRPLSARPSTR